MNATPFGSDLWIPALDKYAEATGLSVELFDVDGRVVLNSIYPTPLVELFREYGFEPGLFAECARRCLQQTCARPEVLVDEQHGLTTVGAALVLEGKIVGVAVAGYALAHFSQVAAVQRWAKSAGVPFYRLWEVVHRVPPAPKRRLLLHGELLKVLGDALLREHLRTRQFEETAEKLKAASAAKDEFLAVLSHELRTPLAAIAGWTSVLRKSESLQHVQRAAEAIERNAFLQGRMIDDLLDVNRIAHGTMKLEPEVLELSVCVRAALDSVTKDIEEKAIWVDFVDPGDPLFVEGDAGRIQQIFGNVFSNATKFTPLGGSVRVTLGRDGNDARVVVADTGIGISAEFLPFVFDIFRQQESGMRREYEGLGIGLALVKELTELHKGTVSVTSGGTGRGAEVTVRIPLSAARDAHAAADTEEPKRSPLAGLSVLVIDDVADAREALQVLLQQLGAKVSVARDGREALDMMPDVDPGLVLCDLRMPRMDGFEFIHELQRRAAPSRHPPVVAFSALASDGDRQRIRDAGFEGYLRKPFDSAAVVVAADAALGHGGKRQAARSQVKAPSSSSG